MHSVMKNASAVLFRATGVQQARVPLLALALMFVVAVCAVSYLALASFFLRNAEQVAPQRAQFFASAMDTALARLEHLPYVLSIDNTTLDALVQNDASRLNPILETVAERAQAEFVYVLDINGRTIASSNYQDSDTLVGNNYTFRPYFRDAIAGGQGRFYAVGVTTGRPGYFIAEPVRAGDGTIFGVVVVKIAFEDLSRTLSNSGELVLVTNAQGVVLASSQTELIYGFIAPLSSFARRTLEEQQQFGDQTLFPLDWTSQEDRRAQLDGTNYVWTQAQLANEDWTLHLISLVSDFRRQALLYVAFGMTALLALAVAAAIYRAAQLRAALAISNADRQRLATEIEDRKSAETRLEEARLELARQNQLAALGQLSASITHELGQPISAMRNYLVAEEIATDAKPGSILPEMSGLVDRMQRILSQLRLFGRTPTTQSESFAAQQTVHAALKLVQHTADQSGVALEITMPQAPCALTGQPERFEQVIVNMLRNGIDAAQGQPNAKVRLNLVDQSDAISLRVSDNGPGLGDLNIADLREPFFSTKPSGKGMGLGLAISGQIVNEMGGTLHAENGPHQGAVFCVIFPKSSTANA